MLWVVHTLCGIGIRITSGHWSCRQSQDPSQSRAASVGNLCESVFLCLHDKLYTASAALVHTHPQCSHCAASLPANHALCSGFCRHQVPGFGPWHRAYLRQFELGLIESAKEAAANFQDRTLRSQFEDLAETIRLPYWDWTNPSIPNLLTARSVTVLDFETGEPTSIRNPLGAYQYTVSEHTAVCCWAVVVAHFSQLTKQHLEQNNASRCSSCKLICGSMASIKHGKQQPTSLYILVRHATQTKQLIDTCHPSTICSLGCADLCCLCCRCVALQITGSGW